MNKLKNLTTILAAHAGTSARRNRTLKLANSFVVISLYKSRVARKKTELELKFSKIN